MKIKQTILKYVVSMDEINENLQPDISYYLIGPQGDNVTCSDNLNWQESGNMVKVCVALYVTSKKSKEDQWNSSFGQSVGDGPISIQMFIYLCLCFLRLLCLTHM
jgi:hypothetical protein